MNQQMMPFGVGTRVCGGQNLAQVMLRIVVAGVARNFSVSAQASETNDRTMQMCDAFVSVIAISAGSVLTISVIGPLPGREGVQAHVHITEPLNLNLASLAC